MRKAEKWYQMIPKILTAVMGSGIIEMHQQAEEKRTESKIEVQTYLDRLKYALQTGSARLTFQKDRTVDRGRDQRFTNRYTMGCLFPDEDEVVALKRELQQLTVEEYMETVRDTRFPSRSEMRVFGRVYSEEDIYIKIRVELVSTQACGDSFIFVMSFHYAKWNFKECDFPYKKG